MDAKKRDTVLNHIDGKEFDVVIIGGGIMGAGICHDAAARGLKVLLLEAKDYGSGTSSKSSGLIHGGFRYLARGSVQMVREAAQERKVLTRIAPHLAQPTTFVLPVKSLAQSWLYRSAINLYEKLGTVTDDEKHSWWCKNELQKRMPILQNESLGAIAFREYLTEDCRLVLANLRGAKKNGATILNYTPVTQIVRHQQIGGVLFQNSLSNESEIRFVKAKIIVNATGPWTDEVSRLEAHGAKVRLRLSKGIHIAVQRRKLPLDNVLAFRAEDGRYLFAVPRHNITYLGTTDTMMESACYHPEVSGNEVDYLLDSVNRHLSVSGLVRQDIIYTWAGIRPLVFQRFRGFREFSRREKIWQGPGPVITVAGGKLTTYRRIAERATDQIVARLNRIYKPCTSDKNPLPGGDISISDLERINSSGTSAEKRLFGLYGSEAEPMTGVPLDEQLRLEVLQGISVEGAMLLEDFWFRRSRLVCYGADDREHLLGVCAQIMADELQWGETFKQAQIAHCRSLTNRPMDGSDRYP